MSFSGYLVLILLYVATLVLVDVGYMTDEPLDVQLHLLSFSHIYRRSKTF